MALQVTAHELDASLLLDELEAPAADPVVAAPQAPQAPLAHRLHELLHLFGDQEAGADPLLILDEDADDSAQQPALLLPPPRRGRGRPKRLPGPAGPPPGHPPAAVAPVRCTFSERGRRGAAARWSKRVHIAFDGDQPAMLTPYASNRAENILGLLREQS